VSELADQIDQWLPQTQCRRCGYPDCRAYAEAVASGAAGLNRCPPGGDVTISALASLTGRDRIPLDPGCGPITPRAVAVVEETLCIGCLKCIEACPVDAIVGARKLMHTVIAAECTGCGLCLPPCPMDCIEMVPAAQRGDPWPEHTRTEAERFRERYRAHRERAARNRAGATATEDIDRARRRAEIRSAVRRVRDKRRGLGLPAPGLKR